MVRAAVPPARNVARATPHTTFGKVPMDHSRTFAVVALGLAALTAACGGKPPAESPEPVSDRPAPVSAPAPTPVAVETPTVVPDNRLAVLEERIYFALDRAELSPEARAKLAEKVEVLRMSPGLALRIDGHADERGSDEYNLALSKRRAAVAKRFLVQQGIESARLEVEGYGEEQPLDPASNEAAWSLNRRAGFQITSGKLGQL
jgi:peptidoglycan-associated lipoprotein